MTANTSNEDKILEALRSGSGDTVAELAEAAGIGRSTAGKALGALEEAGRVRRTEGGRDGGRRLPDRFEVVVATAAPAGTQAQAEGTPAEGGTASRLGSGALRALVLADLAGRGEPVSPTAIAKALGRSGGAVSNALERLVAEGAAERVNDHPRRYVPKPS
jgi:DNA-binding MarR family transcriptional regulator